MILLALFVCVPWLLTGSWIFQISLTVTKLVLSSLPRVLLSARTRRGNRPLSTASCLALVISLVHPVGLELSNVLYEVYL